ncbi:MAG: hypothetical protein WCJ84_00945 [Candidatus Peregrinibacteria bacterium]
MAFLELSSFGRYAFHTIFVLLSLGGVVFAAGTFESRLEKVDFRERDQVQEVVGSVSTMGDFSEIPSSSGMLFSPEQVFKTAKESSMTLDFGGFTAFRMGTETKATIKGTFVPAVTLESGEIWVTTIENATVALPNLEIFLSGGTANIVYRDGKATIQAVKKSLILNFMEGGKKSSSFFLPEKNQITLVPSALLSSSDQKNLRFSKLKKEFHLSSVDETEAITAEIKKDDAFFEKTKQTIRARSLSSQDQNLLQQESTFGEDLTFFRKKQEENALYRNMIRKKEIWDTVQKGQSSLLSTKVTGTSLESTEELQYWNALSLFANASAASEQQSLLDALKKRSPEIPSAFFDFLLLERLVSAPGEIDTKTFPKTFTTISDRLQSYFTQHPEDLDGYYFLVSSLLQNYPQKKVTNETVALLQTLGDDLVAQESDPYFQTTRKLELVDETFEMVQNLTKAQSYELAKSLLASSLDRIQKDQTAELAPILQKIIQQKIELEHRILFAQVGGGGTEEEFQAFVQQIGTNTSSQDISLDTIALLEKFSTQAKQQFESHGIYVEAMEQAKDAPHLFSLSMAVNEQKIPFSALYNADADTFSRVTFLLKEKPVTTETVYTGEEMAKITEEDAIISATAVHAAPSENTADTPPSSYPQENTKFLSPETVELALSIAQKDFKNTIIVKPIDIIVQSNDVVFVRSAKAFSSAPESKPVSISSSKGAQTAKDFSFSFTYNLREHMATKAQIIDSSVTIEEKLSAKDLVTKLQALAQENRAKDAALTSVQNKFSTAGFTVKKSDLVLISTEEVQFTNLPYQKDLFFSGSYNPQTDVFLSVTEKNNALDAGFDMPFVEFMGKARTYLREKAQQK